MIMQFKGGRKDESSVAVLTDLKNIKIKQKQQEERIRRQDSVWLFKFLTSALCCIFVGGCNLKVAG